MSYVFATVGYLLIVAGLFLTSRIGSLLLGRAGADRSVTVRRLELFTRLLIGFGVVGALSLTLDGASVGQWAASIPPIGTSGTIQAVFYGAIAGIVVALGVGAVRRGAAPLRSRLVDDSDLTPSARHVWRWWVATSLLAVPGSVLFVLLLEGRLPLGPFGFAVGALFLLSLSKRIKRPLLAIGERRRDPSADERERIESALERIDRSAGHLVVRHGVPDAAPAVAIDGRGNEWVSLEAAFLESASEEDLAVALAQASEATRRRYPIRVTLANAFLLTALVLGVAVLSSAVWTAPFGPFHRTLADPVVLALAAFGAAGTAFVLNRSARRAVYDADRFAVARLGVGAVHGALDRHGNALTPRPLHGQVRSNYQYGLPTADQRSRHLERSEARGDDTLPPAVSRRGTVAIAGGWGFFGVAGAVYSLDLVERLVGGGVGEPVLAVSVGVLVGLTTAVGYAVLSDGLPSLWLPLTRTELPLGRRHVRRQWAAIVTTLAVVATTFVLVSRGLVGWWWLLIAPVWVLVLRALAVPLPFHVPRARVREPTDTERTTLERAFEPVERPLPEVVVFESDSDWGWVHGTRALGAGTIWIHESVIRSWNGDEIAVSLVRADELGRQHWYQRGIVLPMAVLVTFFVALGILLEPVPYLAALPALLYLLAAIPLGLLSFRFGRSPVYRADAFAGATFGSETVRDVYGLRGENLRNVRVRTDDPDRLGRLQLTIVGAEPSLQQRLERLGELHQSADD